MKNGLRILVVLTLLITGFYSSAQEIGVNVNGQFDQIDFNDLSRTNTTWVRGFLDFFQFYNGGSNLDTDPRVQQLLQLHANGYKVILNIKFDFKNKSFPAPNSPEINNQKAFLETIYNKVWSGIDIIVVGNEPFIESDQDGDQAANGPLVKYYRQMCIKTNNYRNTKSRKNPIYLGSFDNLYLNSKRKQSVVDLLAFAKNHNYMAGIDLHIHHTDINQINSVFDWVKPQIRSDQKILVTEYSLMKHWRNYLDTNINAGFASRWGKDPNRKVYQFLDYTLKNQVSRAEWLDFFQSHSWYDNRKRYVRDSYNKFKAYGQFHVATYALRQSYPNNKDFTSNTDPWILNPLYINRTVDLNSSNQYQFNYQFIDDFRAIQNGTIARLDAQESITDDVTPSIEIFPNPVVNTLHIVNHVKDEEVKVYDVKGQLKGSYSGESIDFTDYESGLYFLLFSSSDRQFKVIKR